MGSERSCPAFRLSEEGQNLHTRHRSRCESVHRGRCWKHLVSSYFSNNQGGQKVKLYFSYKIRKPKKFKVQLLAKLRLAEEGNMFVWQFIKFLVSTGGLSVLSASQAISRAPHGRALNPKP